MAEPDADRAATAALRALGYDVTGIQALACSQAPLASRLSSRQLGLAPGVRLDVLHRQYGARRARAVRRPRAQAPW
ncbi:hypothetical protein ACFQ6N_17550 [Kitasatospora sp. NPDC056446]|uniref:hypothetical protein n=1 Tax=Kitasatospora sp. NPDC056446 TaxID=3345819 RepID=UPI0036C4454B